MHVERTHAWQESPRRGGATEGQKAIHLGVGLEANDRSREPLLEAGGAIDRANYYGTVRRAC